MLLVPMRASATGHDGRMAEWFKAPVLKTGRGFTLPRGFESHSFRQFQCAAVRACSDIPRIEAHRPLGCLLPFARVCYNPTNGDGTTRGIGRKEWRASLIG